jgi:hypothetical protein
MIQYGLTLKDYLDQRDHEESSNFDREMKEHEQYELLRQIEEYELTTLLEITASRKVSV